ncbi:sensor histidine kinase [Burkholderia contaminans]|uniref:sensor histidine kinase n=1 Tax=Burkholderia contaminans TaxID=488447 RepID=UPI003C7C80EF
MGVLLLIWVLFLIHIIRQQSVYDLVGPTENPYWGIAQFRIAADEFESSLLKYKSGYQQDPDEIKFKYEILVSKFFIISQHSDTTKSSYQLPLYASIITDLDRQFAKTDELMKGFPEQTGIVDSLINSSIAFETSYVRFVNAVGMSEAHRRDALLSAAFQNRRILLYSNIVASIIFFAAIAILARSVRNFIVALHAAQQVSHTKQVFLAAINHELRNPLQTIVSATENISHYAINRELMIAVDNIDRATRHIETHMRDLTDYLRLNTNKVNLHISIIDLQKICNETVRKFKSKADEKNIRIHTTICTPLTKLFSDEQRVQQIIDNLVENAIKYSTGGIVEIRCSIPSAYESSLVTIDVADQGIGIDKHKVNYLFSPFFQSSSSQNSVISGYGMGLAVVRGLVEVLGGQISVESDIGKGTTFTVKLPYRSHSMSDMLSRKGAGMGSPDAENS